MKSKKMFVLMIVLFVISLGNCKSAFAEQIVAWGWNDYGQCDAPEGGGYVAIAAGSGHSLALHSDGTLAAWGDNSFTQCDIPPDSNFVAITAGHRHSLAIRSDGSLAAWGDNGDGQCNVPFDNFVDIAGGAFYSLGLRSNGLLAAWGDNWGGQCNVPDGNDFVAIATGAHHGLAIRSDGSLAAWGWNDYGQCDVPAGNDFVDIAGGVRHSLALRSDGTLVAWGDNVFGECNVPPGNDFVAVSAPCYNSWGLAHKMDGSLVAWATVFDPPEGNQFVAIAAGGGHGLALLLTGDECECAMLAQSNQPYNGTTVLATGTETSSCGYNDTLDVWYSFTPKFNYEYTISLCGSAFDTTLAVFDGCGGTELACNDDAEPGACPNKWPSEFTLPLLRNSTYFIRIAGYDQQIGDYTLTIHGPRCTGHIPGDLNNDCKISFIDFAIMSSHWLECNLVPSEVCWQ